MSITNAHLSGAAYSTTTNKAISDAKDKNIGGRQLLTPPKAFTITNPFVTIQQTTAATKMEMTNRKERKVSPEIPN